MAYEVDYITALMPSSGYFGASQLDCLEVKVGNKIKEVIVFLEDKEVLNLQGIELYSGLEKLDLDVEHATSSSCHKKSSPNNLLLRKGFHSQREERPWWKVKLDKAAFLSKIKIYNRGDQWGVRSRKLVVECYDEDGEKVLAYRNFSNTNLMHDLVGIFEVVGFKDNVIDSLSGSLDLKMLREGFILPAATQALKSGLISPKSIKPLLSLTNAWGKSESHGSRSELEFLAALVIYAFYNKSFSLSLLKSLSRVLSSKKDLNELDGILRSESRNILGKELMLTKHGVSRVGKLVDNIDSTLEALSRIIEVLELKGLYPVLAYGTLLGAVRGSCFIPHDDDVDILVNAGNAANYQEASLFMDELSKQLDGGSYRVGKKLNSLNRHFVDRELGVSIDVFPYWEEDGLYMLHMEKMKVRGVDKSIFSRRCEACLYSICYPAPENIKAFLFERYGENWETPDPFHEWPWKLKES